MYVATVIAIFWSLVSYIGTIIIIYELFSKLGLSLLCQHNFEHNLNIGKQKH